MWNGAIYCGGLQCTWRRCKREESRVRRVGCECLANDTAQRITVHCIALHCIAVHYSALHYSALHYSALHYSALHYSALHYSALHCITLHYITVHYITVHCITVHCITVHCIALQCIALQCITVQCRAEILAEVTVFEPDVADAVYPHKKIKIDVLLVRNKMCLNNAERYPVTYD